jgi:hypothetical protein
MAAFAHAMENGVQIKEIRKNHFSGFDLRWMISE